MGCGATSLFLCRSLKFAQITTVVSAGGRRPAWFPISSCKAWTTGSLISTVETEFHSQRKSVPKALTVVPKARENNKFAIK